MPSNPVLAPFKAGAHNHDQCVSNALGDAEKICERNGVKLTRLRRRVLELVWRSHEPVRAYDLLDRLRDERRGAAPPTVYRALDFLLKNGLVHRIETLNAYIGCGGPHTEHGGQFLICGDCGAVAEMDDPDISRDVREKAHALGFQVLEQTIEITGLCPECNSSKAADHAN